jgi:hypothetical protein
MPNDTQNPGSVSPRDEPGQGDGPGDTRPYLCIPYWETPLSPGGPVDIGEARPLPGTVISWECPGIHASAFQPGAELNVTVDVRNSGGGSATAIATVLLYWAIPTAGFAKPTFFGVATVAAPPMRDALVAGFVSASFSGVIPASAPDHICLLACVTHSLDQAKPVADPINDRHWAQHNLIAQSQKADPMAFPFFAGNPFSQEAAFGLVVRALDRARLDRLASDLKLEPAEGTTRLQLLDGLGHPITDVGEEARTQLTLNPHGQRPYSLVLRLGRQLAGHQMNAFETILTVNRTGNPAVGSLGIVILGNDSG